MATIYLVQAYDPHEYRSMTWTISAHVSKENAETQAKQEQRRLAENGDNDITCVTEQELLP